MRVEYVFSVSEYFNTFVSSTSLFPFDKSLVLILKSALIRNFKNKRFICETIMISKS